MIILNVYWNEKSIPKKTLPSHANIQNYHYLISTVRNVGVRKKIFLALNSFLVGGFVHPNTIKIELFILKENLYNSLQLNVS